MKTKLIIPIFALFLVLAVASVIAGITFKDDYWVSGGKLVYLETTNEPIKLSMNSAKAQVHVREFTRQRTGEWFVDVNGYVMFQGDTSSNKNIKVSIKLDDLLSANDYPCGIFYKFKGRVSYWEKENSKKAVSKDFNSDNIWVVINTRNNRMFIELKNSETDFRLQNLEIINK